MTYPRFAPAVRGGGGLLLASLMWAMSAAHAQPQQGVDASAAPASAPPSLFAPGERGQVEAGIGGANLSDGQKNWADVYLRGHVGLKPGSTLHWNIGHQRHFGESGALGGVSLVQDLSPDWYAMAGVSGGAASFQHRYRLDAGLYRKWGADRRWVTGLALMHAKSGDGVHRDNALRASAIYYSPEAWVAEGGVSANRSSPGSVWSTRFYGAATIGKAKSHYLTVRLEHGQEGYLPVAAGLPFPADVRFHSTEATIQWRQWVDRDWGFVAGTQFYRNPYYRRAGLQVGVFFDF